MSTCRSGDLGCARPVLPGRKFCGVCVEALDRVREEMGGGGHRGGPKRGPKSRPRCSFKNCNNFSQQRGSAACRKHIAASKP